jgi:SAM-dependent methyltransferase
MIMPDGSMHESTQQYVRNSRIAYEYDQYFADNELFQYDSQVLAQWFVEPGRLIDFGCGTGRHLVPFVRRGFEGVGVDLSEHMLAITQEKLERENLSARLIRANFCENINGSSASGETLELGSFDYGLCMFSTLGLIYGRENRQRFLHTVRSLLKPSGQLALHVHNRAHNWFTHEGRCFLLSNFIRARLGRAEIGDKHLSTYRGLSGMYIHVFSRAEILRLLAESGLVVQEIIALNSRRNGPLQSGWFRDLRANGFLIRAGVGQTTCRPTPTGPPSPAREA